jgi:hypothetical protein
MSKLEYNVKCRICLFEQFKELDLSTINFDKLPSSEIEYVDILEKQNNICPKCDSKNQDFFNLKIDNLELCVPNEIDHFILRFIKTDGKSSTIKTGGTPDRYDRNNLFRMSYRKIYESIESIQKEKLQDKDDGIFEIIVSVDHPDSDESIRLERIRYFGYCFDDLKTIINSLGRYV